MALLHLCSPHPQLGACLNSRAAGLQGRNGSLFSSSKLNRLRCRAVTVEGNNSSGSDGKRSFEVVYDPYQKLEEMNTEHKSRLAASSLTLFSPSKINVFLRILSKRPDGFHDLASLFHVINLGDIIKFSVAPSSKKDSLTTNVGGIPLDERNLIIKALNLYRMKTGSNLFYWIHLDKRVPTGAGLGGGSGNAATALWAANRINGSLATEKELQQWSAEIGSDIPFFFSTGAAYCTGRGEIVENVPSLPLDLPMVLLKPKEECSTAEVYKGFHLERASSMDPSKLLEEIMNDGISQSVCVNDLELPAFEVLPSLKRLKDRTLAAGRGKYDAVFMSGSGSTIVGIGDPEPPQFIYEEELYQDTFVTEASFLTRKENEWYKQVAT